MRRAAARALRLAGAAAAAAVLTVAGAAPAVAHPLGNFTVNRYDGLAVGARQLVVDHVEDLAEIPAAQVLPDVDTDHDGTAAPAELASWARTRCAAAARGSAVAVDGRRTVPVAVARSAAEPRPGQAGLRTLRVECLLTAALPAVPAPSGTRDAPDAERALVFTAARGDGAPGWHEVTARGDRTALTASDVPSASRTARLTAYPRDALSSPADATGATLRVRPGGPALARPGAPAAAPAGILPRGADRLSEALTGLVARHRLTPGFALLALGAALVLGALHALAPGHGKTIMAAAAVAGRGRRRTLRDVSALGLTVTLTHTLGVLGLGLLVAAGSAAAPSVLSWLGVASGLLVTAAGVTLLRTALRDGGHGHGHHDHHHDSHDGHGHGHDGHGHDGHGHGHGHRVLGGGRSLRGAVVMGLAGGMVPSPSAVVVLVGAAALGQAWFGGLLVLAYGAGLALTLIGVGLLAVRAGHRLTRWAHVRTRAPRRARLLGAASRLVPVGTAGLVLALGCGLVLRGVAAAVG
ncbi:nickel transporter [Streptomyces sp. NPDC001380]|uniref:nickel transporter n=1 Tax=Streptomyces sp. NPDC001380 TaxID=3364566 RepID=UPI0036BDA4F9